MCSEVLSCLCCNIPLVIVQRYLAMQTRHDFTTHREKKLQDTHSPRIGVRLRVRVRVRARVRVGVRVRARVGVRVGLRVRG